uniref:Bifunctional inhibitor/plant lipid transfer protein/seed storage helical domain-containing protein n=1 Tax=Leersia perrieri TaxID=77586 RepID=A0A0D9W8S1_9ORYZ
MATKVRRPSICLVLALIFIIFTVHQASGENDCYDQKDWVLDRCKHSIKKNKPYRILGERCRNAIKKSDLLCICSILTSQDETEISVEKLAQAASECGKALPSGTKCGSSVIDQWRHEKFKTASDRRSHEAMNMKE